MTDQEEIQYWNDFIDGNTNTLSVLFKHYVKGLVAYGMKISPDEELVKDSIQEVFIKLIHKRHKLKKNLKISGLVYRMLRNQMIDQIKVNNRGKKIDHLIFNPHLEFEMDAEHQRISFEDERSKNKLFSLAMEQLSAHQKEVMFLKYFNGFNYEEVSEVMGISVASTRTLVYRTLKQLKSQLSGK